MFTNTIFDAMNRMEHPNAGSVLRSLRVVYFSLILGIVSFIAVTFLISQELKFTSGKGDPVFYATLVLFIISVPAGNYVSLSMWKKIGRELPLKDKLLKYQPAFLVRMGTCEGVGLFSTVGFLLSGNLLYIVITSIVLLIIFSYFP